MLIEQVDYVRLEPLERTLDGLLDLLGPAVQTCGSGPMIGAAEIEPEFGGDHHLLAERSEGFANQLFVQERAVDLGGVEERDAALHGRPEKGSHLLLIFGRAVRKAHPHTAEPESR